jgi:hypothetical protein
LISSFGSGSAKNRARSRTQDSKCKGVPFWPTPTNWRRPAFGKVCNPLAMLPLRLLYHRRGVVEIRTETNSLYGDLHDANRSNVMRIQASRELINEALPSTTGMFGQPVTIPTASLGVKHANCLVSLGVLTPL